MRGRVLDDRLTGTRDGVARHGNSTIGNRHRGYWAAHLRWLMLLPLLWPAACQRDTRIDMDQLTELEQKGAPPVAVEQRQLALTDYHPYTIGVGDVLFIKLISLTDKGYEGTEIKCRVHDDGCIIAPKVGPIKVAGLDLGQAEQAIRAPHMEVLVKDLSVYVQLENQENTTVLVQGAATTPGLVKLKQNERNPLYALAAASGFGVASSGRIRVKPIRPDRQELVYNFNDVNDVRRALLGPPLESGDVLVVEGLSVSAVYVSGLVNKPGPVDLPPNTTLSVQRAIAAAGGIRDYLDPKEATLVRSLEGGQQVQVKLDLGDMLAGNTPDLALRSGDVLRIPYTADTLFQEWFYKNMLLGPFSVGVRYDPLAQWNANRAINAGATSGNQWSNVFRSSLSSSIPLIFTQPAAGQ